MKEQDCNEVSVSTPTARSDFFALTPAKLETFLNGKGHPRFRAKQLYQWVYHKGTTDSALMTDLSKEFRAQVPELFSFCLPAVKLRKVSADGTRKYLFELGGSGAIETVLVKQPLRSTLCISSQVGCAMGCSFCRTAAMGLSRNLTASEIVGQVYQIIEDARNFNDSFQNIVFMGMGEPLHNLDAVCEALEIIQADNGLAISGRRITVSTSGLVPKIDELGRRAPDVNLAVSLNATSDDVRSSLMPVNKRFPLEELLECLRRYPLKRRKRITIEYVLMKGINDSAADLKRLPKLLHAIPSKINLIPFNETPELCYRAPAREVLERWHDALLRSGIETTIRWSRGADIQAACGQLAAEQKNAGVCAP